MLRASLPLPLPGLLQERGVQIQLRHTSLSLHSVQQLLLEGLTAGLLLPGSSSGSSSSSGGTGQQVTFLHVERLLLEHQHDGSFSLQHLQARMAAAEAPAAAAGGSPQAAAVCLQRVSLQLGATSLTASQQLLDWVQSQQNVAAEAARRRRAARQEQHREEQQQQRQEPEPGSAGRHQRVQRLLALLPRQAELAANSCSLSTATSEGGHGLPLLAACSLRGLSCRLTKAAPADSSSSGASLASVAAGWQQLSASLGAAPAAAGNGQQQLPPAVAVSSGVAEWSLALSGAAGGAAGTATAGEQGPLIAAATVSIGALHTNVCHPAVQPLVTQLQLAVAAVKSASRSASASSSGGQAEQQQPQPQRQKGGPAGPPLLAEWQGSLHLGDGSRLLFTDAAGSCCWSNGLASCRLAVRGSSSNGGSNGGSSVSPSGAASNLSGSFEVAGIEMYAATTATGSPADVTAQSQQQGQPPQMLSAKLLRVQLEHSAVPQQREQGLPEGALEAGSAVDAATAGVHLLLQQQQLAQVASVIASLLPPPKASSDSAASGACGGGHSDTAHAASLAAVAAAAVADSAPRKARGGRLPRLSFACSDTLLLLPTTVAVPAEQTGGGQLLLLPAAPALVISSVAASLGGGGAGGSVHAEGCCLLYCEGPAAQRFPASSDALKGELLLLLFAGRRLPHGLRFTVETASMMHDTCACLVVPPAALQSKPRCQCSAWILPHCGRRQRRSLALMVAAGPAAACTWTLGLWQPRLMPMRCCAWRPWRTARRSSWRRCWQ